ncbi:MAG: methyltransferase domain-containing protein [Candidatus Falkowbacteria bacterium]|nr:methyltransferase domain-containing protein [Candidatus Falkowbacteria bacterium]
MKLHLGCGGTYLDGYINVDFPTSDKTIMNVKADIYQDIRTLNYPENSIDEIRNHHVFEHFNRVDALKVLLQWRGWLKPGGKLVIETPDFF